MTNKRKILLLIALALAAMLVAGCGGAKYENYDDVIEAAEKHTFTDCTPRIASLVGAISNGGCTVDGGGWVDIFVFDGDPKNLCQKNDFCREAANTMQVRYTANAAIFQEGDHSTNILDALIADIED